MLARLDIRAPQGGAVQGLKVFTIGQVVRAGDEEALRGDLSWLPAGPHVVVWVGSTALREAQPAEYATALGVLRHATSASTGTDRPLTVLLAPE